MKLLLPMLVLVATPQFCLAENEVSKGAKDAGVLTCHNIAKSMADFVLKGAPHSSHNIWSTDAPNKRMYESFTIKSYSDNNSQIVFTAAPNLVGTCDISSVETLVVSGSCLTIRDKVFKDWAYKGEAQGTAVLVNDGGGLYAYLTPQLSNSVCLVTKREVVFGS
ncbi:conserved exported protein of unknown function [Pseudomonas marincola]|uniref:Uncharacterized protein n=1 Tax=Pseudomonas marincola TaxID=437900 RepID=A0A653E080_9PSED|nr:hypothetical protein [Pseudomonas marincola]CAE6945383.1 conserved exported protein of unknown function [Pseudomonas marincola]